MADRVRYRVEDGIYIVELNSPPNNPTDQLFFVEMAEVVAQLQTDVKCRGVVIRGRGANFSSGSDFDELVSGTGKKGPLSVEESGFRSVAIFEGLAALGVPVVAAVKGECFGSGLELALACHYRVAAKSAVFAMPEAGCGLMPGCGGTYRLPRLIGAGPAIGLILSGGLVKAADALEMNLVDVVVEEEKLMDAAQKIIMYRGSTNSVA